MKVKYIIHRSKQPFAEEKKRFQQIVDFYSEQYPKLRFIDKGLRFSVENGNTFVDFDFGYLNMRYRDFSGYHRVISQSPFTITNQELNPGDLAFPNESKMMRINSSNTKVRLYDRNASYNNRMGEVFDDLCFYEKAIETDTIKKFVTATLSPTSTHQLKPVTDLNVKKNARFCESNAFFYPSKVKGADSLLKQGEKRIKIDNLQTVLEGEFDGINCEAKQMIENVGDRLVMFGIGHDKPYHGPELPRKERTGPQVEKHIPTYNDAQVSYFLTLFFGYCLAKDFNL